MPAWPITFTVEFTVEFTGITPSVANGAFSFSLLIILVPQLIILYPNQLFWPIMEVGMPPGTPTTKQAAEKPPP
ncbi:MAG TPA: hypothetical protein DER58_00470 [Firmicutes bacterium]|nr:hypothetical protein [Bacillota bacterium]